MRWLLPVAVCVLVGCSPGKLFGPPLYESEAKLLVRYVVYTPVRPVKGTPAAEEEAKRRDEIISTEVEILTSWDLFMQVAKAVGYKRLSAGTGSPATIAGEAAKAISQGLRVTTSKDSNVLVLSFRSGDPGLPEMALKEIITQYFQLHLQVHRSKAASNEDFEHVEEARAQLRSMNDLLDKLESEAGDAGKAEAGTAAATQIEQLKQAREKLKAAIADSQVKLEKVRIDETLDPSKSPNITVVQQPTAARHVKRW